MTIAAAFPGDRVSRVAKGQKGADVLFEIVLSGETVVASIVLDSKAHARWSNRFTSKLRSDQLAAGAAFAILVSSTFPKDAEQLHLQDGVLVASPGRVVVLVQLLRHMLIEQHRLKLSVEARDEKGDQLLAFIVSPAGTDLLDRPGKWIDGMIDLEAKEVEQQLAVHRKRGELIRAIQRDHEELVEAIDQIVSGAAFADEEASV